MSTPPGHGSATIAKRAKRVTLADVARLAGVSQTAASFVLTGRREEMRISAEVEERVLHAAQATGYRPNIVSRSLRTGKTQTIGFISDTVATTPFAGNLIKGALEAARDRGHLLLIAETEGDEKLQEELLEAMIDRDVDGIVLASMYTRKLAVPKALHGRHAVLLNAVPLRSAPLLSVIPDEYEAGRTAARTLLSAHHTTGIHAIGVGMKPTEITRQSLAAAERFRGIRDALAEAGTRLAGAVACVDWQPELGYAAVRGLLAKGTDVRALICFNDRVSIGAYNALAEAGLSVPDDVSVVSFDDDPLASWIRPQLTTIAIPHYELGRRSIELLLDAEDPPTTSTAPERLPMPLRTRDSVRRIG
jgi:LacI family transcriptional regulator, galactose operon repressor